jgi:hypothetical protein
MNVDAVIIAPNASWPGLEALAAKYGIPVLLADGARSSSRTASEAIDQAVRHSQTAFYGAVSRRIQPGNAEGASVLQRGRELTQALQSGRITGVAVLFGETLAKQTFFERTLALMEAAVAERALVLLAGDLGSQVDALGAELAKRQSAQVTAFAAELEKDDLRPVVAFGSAFEIPRVVSLLSGISRPSGDGAFPTIFAFPEFYRASTWATAVSLLSLGFTVQVGTRLPFWGSPSLAEALKGEWARISGGTLLAAPALPDVRAQAEELAACFTAGRVH